MRIAGALDAASPRLAPKKRTRTWAFELHKSLAGFFASGVARVHFSDPHTFAQHDQLAEMIGVVIGYEQGFAQDCLSVSPG